MLVETIVAVTFGGISAGAYAVSQRVEARLKGGFHGVRSALRMLPIGAGDEAVEDPDADLLAAIEKGERDAAADVAARHPRADDRGDRRGDRDPG